MLQVLLLAFLATAAALPLTIRLLRRAGAVDRPNERSSHARPTPRGGGAALVFGGGLAVVLVGDIETTRESLALAGLAFALGGLGLLDDLRGGLGPFPRLVVALAAAAIAAVLVFDRWSGMGAVLAVGSAAVWIAGFTNAFNFMDGIDGISAINGAVIAGVLWWLASEHEVHVAAAITAAVCGACLAFVPFNAVRARVFLGDVGSYAVGGTLASVAVVLVDHGVSPAVVVAPFFPYVADTTLTVVRRINRRQPFYEAHREHSYQRLTDLGFSHQRVALAVGAVTTACGLLAITADAVGGKGQAAAFASVLVIAGAFAIMPHMLPPAGSDARRATRR